MESSRSSKDLKSHECNAPRPQTPWQSHPYWSGQGTLARGCQVVRELSPHHHVKERSESKNECLNTHDSDSWMLEMKTNIFLEHSIILWGHSDYSHLHTCAKKECSLRPKRFWIKSCWFSGREPFLNLLPGFASDRFAVVMTFSRRVLSILLVSQTTFTTFPRLVPRVKLLHARFSEKLINLLP